jgi:hypothetical protein
LMVALCGEAVMEVRWNRESDVFHQCGRGGLRESGITSISGLNIVEPDRGESDDGYPARCYLTNTDDVAIGCEDHISCRRS